MKNLPDFKFLLIGTSFVGAYLIKNQIIKELYESGTITDEKLDRISQKANAFYDQLKPTQREIKKLISTVKG